MQDKNIISNILYGTVDKLKNWLRTGTSMNKICKPTEHATATIKNQLDIGDILNIDCFSLLQLNA